MFNRLMELVNLVSRDKVRRVEIIGEKYNYNSNVQKLYKGIHEGKYTSDEIAAKALYNSSPDNDGYRQLKYKLERRLLNTLFHIDINNPQFSDAQVAYYTCYRNFAATSILAGRAAPRNAMALAERTLRIAIDYEFTAVAHELARILTNYYSRTRAESKKYRDYSTISDQQFAILTAERTAERYKQEIAFTHAGKTSNIEDFLPIVTNYTKELKKLQKHCSSYRFCLNAFNIYCMRYELAGDYEMVVKEAEEAILFFRRKSALNNKSAVFVFLYKQVSHYMILKSYKKAEEKALEALKCVDEGINNWFHILEHYLILCLHSQQYQKAYTIFIKATSHKNFKTIHPESKELWIVHEAYVHYFIRRGKIGTSQEGINGLKPFRLSKFLNSVPTYSKDKRGVNVALLILQVLFLLEDRKYDKVIDRVESLEQYVYARLRNDDTYRSSCFIRMLIVMVRAQFNKVATLRKTEDYHKKLLARPLEESKQASNVEIAPYEHLWECVLESVEEEFWYREKRR